MTPMQPPRPRALKAWIDSGRTLEAYADEHGVPLATLEQIADECVLMPDTSVIDAVALRRHLAAGGSAWAYARENGHAPGRVYRVCKELGIKVGHVCAGGSDFSTR